MQQLAYLNGEYLSFEHVALPVTDWGFVQGVTVAEQLRTFDGQPFLIAQHLARLQHGLELLGLESALEGHDLPRIIEHLVQQNRDTSPAKFSSDLGVTVFVTPGTYPTYQLANASQDGPVVCVHTYPLAFRRWSEKYQLGIELVTSTTRQIPETAWPMRLKCRSRMHYYLAAREAEQLRPGSVALLLNQEGFVSETPTSNVIAYFEGRGLVSPPEQHALTGISMTHVFEIAKQLGVPATFAPLQASELSEASEVWVTSTPYCMLPVRCIDAQQLPPPWPMFQQIIRHWSKQVDVNIVEQAVALSSDA